MYTRLISRLSDALLPGRCLLCNLPAASAFALCPGCENSLPRLSSQCQVCAEPLVDDAVCGRCLRDPPDFFQIVCPFSYEGDMRHLIGALKHGGQLSAGAALGELLGQHLADTADNLFRPQYLVPMPLHWRRRWHRGFNQAREIARGVVKSIDIPIRDDLLYRINHTAPQQRLSRQARQHNMKHAFSAPKDCRGLHLAIVDDVVTTTSTARAAASALEKAGVASVQIWCVARTALEN